jgi:hypothetical protein
MMEEILFPPGCGAMYRKTVLDEIGLLMKISLLMGMIPK